MRAGSARLQGTRPYGAAEYLAGLLTLLGQTLNRIVRPPFAWRHDFVSEAWIMVKRCALPLAISTFAFGLGAEGINGGGIARQLGVLDRFGTGYVIAGLREVGPFLTGLVMAGVVGTAMCADLGARKVRDELDATAVLGVDTIAQLIAPRFMALLIATPFLAILGFVTNVAGGVVMFIVFFEVPPEIFFGSFPIQLNSIDIVVGNLLKCAIYGVVIATIFSYEGLNVKGGSEGVGRAVNRGVVIAFVAIFVLNFVINSIVLAGFPELQQSK